MKNLLRISALALALAAAVPLATAAAAKSYQATGPVLELTDTVIVIQKGDERWEIARTKDTKVTGDLKVGAKVTVYYKMAAAEIEVKPAADATMPKGKQQEKQPKK